MRWTDREIFHPDNDRLQFDQYSRVLTAIVDEADTPLTIGIFGPWGSGKTSLMRLTQVALAKKYKAPFIVWFNAWKYDQEAALWRALIIQVLNAFRERPLGEEVRQRLDDLEASLYRVVEREELGGISVDWEKAIKGTISGAVHLSLNLLPGLGPALSKLTEKAQEQLSTEDLDSIFAAIQRERHKIYREHIRSVEQFQQQFERLVEEEVLAQDSRLVVFIDDLDRCLPEKAIEVLEALKLFLDAPGCVFFLGADREVIQRGIQVKYRGFLLDRDDPVVANRRIPISGDNYLEKIVQLPFHLLPLDEARVERFIEESGLDLPPHCAEIFAAGLTANPRKVKRTLNIFRMLSELAQLRRYEFKVEIRPQLLAKVVVIQSRYADLYRDIVEYPTLLPDLERFFLSGETTVLPSRPTEPEQTPTQVSIRESRDVVVHVEPTAARSETDPTLLEKYSVRRPLRRLLTTGVDRFADLPSAEVNLYLYLTYTTDESRGAEVEGEVGQRWWKQLLSGDPTKIKTAATAIQSEEEATAAEFRRRLLTIIEQPEQSTSLGQRFSSGVALALLGDPRPFDEMVSIPMDEYPVGRNGKQKHLDGFSIGKYPVTNSQYQIFLNENPDHLAPDHWDQATRAYPPELANRPVTYVSWHDAQAYCRWAAKRLPSVEEWQAAMGGPEGLRYPYGNEFQAGLGNTAETGLRGASPVGIFPAGAASFGLLDGLGNVWEWTKTKEDQSCLLKGLAWDSGIDPDTISHHPDYKSAAIGFRVAE